MKTKEKPVTVVQSEMDPVKPELLATSIRDIARGFARVESSGLNRRALTVLLKDSTGVSMNDIDRVLNALRGLEKNYCIPKVAKQ